MKKNNCIKINIPQCIFYHVIFQELEKLSSRKLRINAKEVMKIAEKLYTSGFISYPRTETNIFPPELNLTPIVEQQTNDPNWGGM